MVLVSVKMSAHSDDEWLPCVWPLKCPSADWLGALISTLSSPDACIATTPPSPGACGLAMGRVGAQEAIPYNAAYTLARGIKYPLLTAWCLPW